MPTTRRSKRSKDEDENYVEEPKKKKVVSKTIKKPSSYGPIIPYEVCGIILQFLDSVTMLESGAMFVSKQFWEAFEKQIELSLAFGREARKNSNFVDLLDSGLVMRNLTALEITHQKM